jgi:plastocyanin domain-containing protein
MRTRNGNSWAVLILAAASLGLLLAAAGCGSGGGVKERVAVEVTQEGFVPKEIAAKAGQPITLVVTRKTDLTCAKQIVFADLGVEKDLPLDQAVEITVTPTKPGDLRFACSMDMVAGKLVVQ